MYVVEPSCKCTNKCLTILIDTFKILLFKPESTAIKTPPPTLQLLLDKDLSHL